MNINSNNVGQYLNDLSGEGVYFKGWSEEKNEEWQELQPTANSLSQSAQDAEEAQKEANDAIDQTGAI